MKKITAKIEPRNNGDIIVLYANKMPIGNISFEENKYGLKVGVLRYAHYGDNKPHVVAFIGATPDSILGQAEFIGRRILSGSYD